MPMIHVNDLTMYYEIHGTGQPLVLIGGLNSDHSLFRIMMPQLAELYQVVTFDNRGVGQTDKPDVPYSIAMMADDTAGLLSALDIGSAHILGVSMGGKIAAELALRHPQCVKSLILISTILQSLKGTPPTLSRRLIPFLLRLSAMRDSHPYYAVARQREASVTHDCMARLDEIHVPTLILHGKNDNIAPYPLAEAMQRGISGSQMRAFPGGHMFFLLKWPDCRVAIDAFLASAP